MSTVLVVAIVLLVWFLFKRLGREGDSTRSDAAPPPGSGATTGAPRVPSARAVTSENAYVANGILGLSATQMRARALKVNPYATPWIGRVDTIPPQSDERTALIDRGLILRGLLTPEQIRDIHRVGDEWLRVYDSVRLAEAIGKQQAEAILTEERAARAARKEQKRREAAERRAAREQAIRARKATDIVFAGRGVSHQLHRRDFDEQALNRLGLPSLATPADLARVLDIPVPALRWLTYHHESPERTHYVYFTIPKRSGGTRLIASPKAHLRRAQGWVLENILTKLDVTAAAHGFVAGRSTLTNALPHVKREVVVNLDLKEFFPSITFARVRGLFASLGYSPAVATLLALLCTESSRAQVEYDGRKYWVAVRERALPQGACTSPILSNLITRKLDRRLQGAVEKLGFRYTRYADDLTFSAVDREANLSQLFGRVRHIVRDEGFVINEKKGRVQRRGSRQEVTGVVVNDRPSVARDEVRKLRAILHNAQRTGLDAQNRDGHPHFAAWLRGKIGYVSMIDPVKGKALAAAMDACTARD